MMTLVENFGSPFDEEQSIENNFFFRLPSYLTCCCLPLALLTFFYNIPDLPRHNLRLGTMRTPLWKTSIPYLNEHLTWEGKGREGVLIYNRLDCIFFFFFWAFGVMVITHRGVANYLIMADDTQNYKNPTNPQPWQNNPMHHNVIYGGET
jgi:hypothetical protein